jgi:hypothetical protein
VRISGLKRRLMLPPGVRAPRDFPLNLILCINNEKTIDRLNPPAWRWESAASLCLFKSKQSAPLMLSFIFSVFETKCFLSPIKRARNVRLLSKIPSCAHSLTADQINIKRAEGTPRKLSLIIIVKEISRQQMREYSAHEKNQNSTLCVLCAQGVRSAIGRKQVRAARRTSTLSNVHNRLRVVALAAKSTVVFPWCAVKPQMLRRITLLRETGRS